MTAKRRVRHLLGDDAPMADGVMFYEPRERPKIPVAYQMPFAPRFMS